MTKLSDSGRTALFHLGLNPHLWQKAPASDQSRRSSGLALAKLSKRGLVERRRITSGGLFYRLTPSGQELARQLHAASNRSRR